MTKKPVQKTLEEVPQFDLSKVAATVVPNHLADFTPIKRIELTLTAHANDGDGNIGEFPLGTMSLTPADFNTGSTGLKGHAAIHDPSSGRTFRIGVNAVVQGSKKEIAASK